MHGGPHATCADATPTHCFYTHTTPTQASSPDHVPFRWDELKLWALGYRQELKRSLTWVHCASCTLSVASVFAFVGACRPDNP